MILVYNKYIPFKGFKAMTIAPFIFIRKECNISDIDINHERIHIKLLYEMLWVFFFLWYIIEYIIRLFINKNAYKSISFELEAYLNENNLEYIKHRKFFNWVNFLNR